MKEVASERSRRYVEMTTSSLKSLKMKKMPATIKESQVTYVIDAIRAYVSDAKHYSKNRKSITSLACVSYAEGLLDALKFLDLADF